MTILDVALRTEPTKDTPLVVQSTPFQLLFLVAVMSRIVEDKGQRQATIGQDSFPCKVHEMLDDVEAHGLSYIVSWQPHGRW